MAVPSSGPLELYGDIGTELGVAQSNVSLGSMSDTAGFPAPDAMSEFYGYSSGVTIDFWMAAGGGGGGSDNYWGTRGGGGGGGGAVRTSGVISGTVIITVGGGGSAGGSSTNGGNSSISGTYTCYGGGRGGGYNDGLNGGNGGAGGGNVAGYSATGTAVPDQGTVGGNGFGSFGGAGGGGGGVLGATTSAASPIFNPEPVMGGNGGLFNFYPWYIMQIFEVGERIGNDFYCSGGGSSRASEQNGYYDNTVGGLGGGGDWQGDAPLANTGGGGGGGGGALGRPGGSGFVVLEIPEASYSGVYTGVWKAENTLGKWFLVYKSSGTYTV